MTNFQSKIIVTGGCGYIGSHTVVELINNGYKAVIFDDLSNSQHSVLDRIYKITGVQPDFVEVDLKCIESTRKAFNKHKDAVAVIHFAAYKAVAESIENPLSYYQNNFFSLINVLLIQRECHINNIIFSSSATVYGNPDRVPIVEDTPTQQATSTYGNTKKVAEEILADLDKADSKLSIISLRYFNPVGAHDSGLIGELPKGIPNNLMPYITQTAAGIREKLMVFGGDYLTKDGTAIRDYIHVVDLAEAHVKAVECLISTVHKIPYEVVNLGTGTGYSVLEVVKTFETVSGISLNYEITERRKGDVPIVYASTDYAKDVLGWEAKRNLKEMIESAWRWEQNLRAQS